MAENISITQREELLQNVRMFEAIVSNQPDDYRSLEILEEAYTKLGQEAEALRTAKRAAAAYARSGLVSKAILALEAVLQRNPDDKEAAQTLKELTSRIKASAEPTEPPTPAAAATAQASTAAKQRVHAGPSREDPESMLGKFLVNHGVLTARQLTVLMEELRKIENKNTGQVPATSLIELMQDQHLVEATQVLELLVDKFKLPYLPLEFYDVDPNIVKTLPRDLCFQWLAVPFDRIGRTLLMGVANPYVRPHFATAGEKVGLKFQWYLNTPQEIKSVFQNAYRLGGAAVDEGG